MIRSFSWVSAQTCDSLGIGDDQRVSWDDELWAIALAVMRTRGDHASVFVATRIGALALEGDLDGVAAWRRVAANMGQLMHEARGSC